MPLTLRGIGSCRIADTPFTVLDLETTGLTPGVDRVIEVAVLRIDPGSEPKLVYDTLVNPRRSVAATEIHGITDADVADAPAFADIAGDLVDALAGSVVTAYNVYFDIRFLTREMEQAGLRHTPPHLCLMYFRPLLGLGSRCSLDDACDAHGINHDRAHVAALDSQVSGRLLTLYLKLLDDRGVATFDELRELGTYQFLSSLANEPFHDAACFKLQPCGRRKSRLVSAEAVSALQAAPQPSGIREYWDALKTVVADLLINDEEMAIMRGIRDRHRLQDEQLRMLHARAFASVIAQFVDDQQLDDREQEKLRRFHRCLSSLGWAPGE